MKRFTVAEAEALIPELEKIFDAVAELAAQARARASRRVDGPAETALAKAQVEFLTAQMEERLQVIVDLGAVPKGLDPALVDFPARVAGRDVFLCWKYGEKAITAYHGADDGFAGRQPLPRG